MKQPWRKLKKTQDYKTLIKFLITSQKKRKPWIKSSQLNSSPLPP